MSLTSPIPLKIREELSADKFMKTCVIDSFCEGRIEWHHAFTYAGKRVNELWSIIPVCQKHHKEESKHRKEINEALLSRISHFNALSTFYVQYPKSNLFKLFLKDS